jgi:hypothetical protein
MRRLLTEVDEQRHARTKATLSQALDSWLMVHEAEANTLAGYEANARRYIKPALGGVPVGKVTTHMLEEFYAQLRRCRTRCNGRPFVEHRVDGAHDCRVVKHWRGPGRPPADGYPPHDCDAVGCRVTECAPHVCPPLSPAMIRQIHITVSAALAAAVRWDWVKSNPADLARTPKLPAPQPAPPSSKEAARIIATAWEQDDDWGTLVWLTMVTGMRRAELLTCAGTTSIWTPRCWRSGATTCERVGKGLRRIRRRIGCVVSRSTLRGSTSCVLTGNGTKPWLVPWPLSRPRRRSCSPTTRCTHGRAAPTGSATGTS